MNQIKNPLSERGEMTAMEPPMGIEPTTYALRVHCSTNWARMASSRIIEKNHFSARKIQKNCYFLFIVSLYDKVWEYDRTSEREFLSVIASYVSGQQRANSLTRHPCRPVLDTEFRDLETRSGWHCTKVFLWFYSTVTRMGNESILLLPGRKDREENEIYFSLASMIVTLFPAVRPNISGR